MASFLLALAVAAGAPSVARAALIQGGPDPVYASLGIQGGGGGATVSPVTIDFGGGSTPLNIAVNYTAWSLPLQHVALKPERTYYLTFNPGGGGGLGFIAPPGYTLYIDGQVKGYLVPTDWGTTAHAFVLHRAASGLPPGVASSVQVGFLEWAVGLGTLPNRSPAGAISLHETGFASSLGSRSALNCGAFDPAIDLISDAYGPVQVCTPQTFVNIYDITGGYQLDFYPGMPQSAKSNGRYPVSGTPYVSYQITASYASTDTLQIVRIAGSSSHTTTVTYTNSTHTWQVNAAGLRLVTQTNTTNGNGDRVETTITTDGAGNHPTRVTKTYHTFAWDGGGNDEIIQEIDDPEGQAYTTNYSYNTDSSAPGSYTRLSSVTYPDGNWVKYTYYFDSNNPTTGPKNGQLQAEYHPWLGNDSGVTPDTANSSNSRMIAYDWDNDWSGVAALPKSSSITITGTPAGQRQTTNDFSQTANDRTLWTRTIADSTGSGTTLSTVVKNYSPGLTAGANAFYRGLPYSVQHPDGTMESYAEIQGTYNGGGSFTPGSGNDMEQVTIRGVNWAADGAGSLAAAAGQVIDTINVIPNQTTETIAYLQNGLLARQETYVYANSGFNFVASTDYSYTASGKLVSSTASNGATYTAEYTNEFKTADTDATGTRIEYASDGLLRVATMTKKGASGYGGYGSQGDITTSYTYDGDGNVIQTQTSGGATTLTASASFNPAGQVVSSTAPGGYTTGFSYSSGGKVQTVTYPTGSTSITTNLVDGHISTLTGTAQVPISYSYTPGSGTGFLTITQYRNGSPTSGDWASVQTDWLGRKLQEQRPSPAGVTVSTTYGYNVKGQLTSVSTSGIAPILYVYTPMGDLEVTAQDVNENGGIDYSGTDRISQTDSNYTSFSGGWWLSTTKSIYVDGSGSPKTIQTAMSRLSGFASGEQAETIATDIDGNVTDQGTSVDRTNKLVTVTTQVPDSNVAAVQVGYNGLLASSTTTHGVTTTFSYDGLGRMTRKTDPRTGSNGSINTSYASGTNLVYQTYYGDGTVIATNGYDSAGRLQSATNQAGYTTSYSYDSKGHITGVSGNGTLPVEYTFDDFGRMTQQTTHGGGANGTTTFSYPTDLPFLGSRTDAANHATSYTYDSLGRVTQRTDARNVTTNYSYDQYTGDLIQVSYSDGTHTLTYAYKRTGAPASVTDVTGTRSFSYASDLQLQQEQLSGFFGANRAITYSYNASGVVGRLNGVDLGNTGNPTADQVTSYGYQADGRVSTIAGNGSGFSNYSFTYGYAANADSLVASVSNTATGYTLSRTYASTRDLTQQVKTLYGATNKAQFDYTYDALDRRNTATHSGEIFGDYGASVGIQYGYDGLGQLTSAAYSAGGTAMPGRQFGYAYDSGGNRTSGNHTGNGSFAETYTVNNLNQVTSKENTVIPVQGTAVSNANVVVQSTTRATRAYNYWGTETALNNTSAPVQGTVSIQAAIPGGGGNPNQVTSVITKSVFMRAFNEALTYDNNGNLISDGQWQYTWNAENQLISMETNYTAQAVGLPDTLIQFTYDYQGRRVKKVVSVGGTVQSERRYVYFGWNVAAELDSSGNVLRHFIWGLDVTGTTGGAGGIGGLLMIQDSGHTYLPAYDSGGNVTALMDASSGGTTTAIYEYSPFGELLRCEGSYAANNPFRFSTKFFDSETGLAYYGCRYYNASLGRWLGRDPIGEQGGLNLYGFVGNSPANLLDALGQTAADDETAKRIAQIPQDMQVFLGKIISAGEAQMHNTLGIIGEGAPWEVSSDQFWVTAYDDSLQGQALDQMKQQHFQADMAKIRNLLNQGYSVAINGTSLTATAPFSVSAGQFRDIATGDLYGTSATTWHSDGTATRISYGKPTILGDFAPNSGGFQTRSTATLDQVQSEAIRLRNANPDAPYIPAPDWVIGSPYYYAFRWYVAPQAYKDDSGPEYLLDFGYKNIGKFYALGQGDVSQQLRDFVGQTGVELQRGLESALANNPALALSRSALLDVAYASHAEAYQRGGFGNLTFQDQMRVAFTPDFGDSFGNRKAYPVFAQTAHLINWTKWGY